MRGLRWSRSRAGERERAIRCAHEVRGPLTALQLALHAAARRGELPPTRLAGLELELRRAALALDDLQGARPQPAAPVDVRDLLTVQVATWQAVADAHGARLELVAPTEATVVHGEAARLAQAVGNLLANAIEHGGERIQVRLREEPGVLRVEVHDDGPGLPVAVHRHRRGRGTRGRGLAVAADAARRHGGRLLALPAPRGARLAVELPSAGDAA